MFLHDNHNCDQSRLLIVVRIVTTIMHSSQTDDHQVWTSTVLHALYPPVYIYILYCYIISLSLSLIQHCPLYSWPPLPLVYYFPLCFLLTPPSLPFSHFLLLITISGNWDILIHIHLITHSTSSRGSRSVMNSLFQYWLCVERHWLYRVIFSVGADRHTEHHDDTLCHDIVTLLAIRIYFLSEL